MRLQKISQTSTRYFLKDEIRCFAVVRKREFISYVEFIIHIANRIFMEEGITLWKPGGTKKSLASDLKLFEEQIHLIYKSLYRYIYSIIRNPALAEDALQNTLEKAYKSFAALKDKNKFKTWMYSIARNETITLLRKYARESLTEEVEINKFFSEKQLLPEDYVINGEIRSHIVEMINQLKPEFRDLILLRYYAEMSLEEISAILNVKINTVKTRHMRAKEKMAEKLRESDILNDERRVNFIRGGEMDAQGQDG